MENITSKLKVGSKIGYLNEKTRRYKYIPIIEIDVLHPKTGNKAVKLREVFNGYNDNIYFEELDNLHKYSNQNNENFTQPTKTLKIKI